MDPFMIPVVRHISSIQSCSTLNALVLLTAIVSSLLMRVLRFNETRIHVWSSLTPSLSSLVLGVVRHYSRRHQLGTCYLSIIHSKFQINFKLVTTIRLRSWTSQEACINSAPPVKLLSCLITHSGIFVYLYIHNKSPQTYLEYFNANKFR